MEPEKNIPRAIIYGNLIVMVLYVIANISYLTVLSVDQMRSSQVIAVDAASKLIGPAARILVTSCVAFSAFGTLNGSILTGGRLFFAAARDKLFPFSEYVSRVGSTTKTPGVAIAVASTFSVLLVFPGTFRSLVSYFGFASWTVYGSVVCGLVYLRYTQHGICRPFKVWPFPVIPIIFILISGFVVISLLIKEKLISLLAFGFMALGLPVYYLFFHSGNKLLLLYNYLLNNITSRIQSNSYKIIELTSQDTIN